MKRIIFTFLICLSLSLSSQDHSEKIDVKLYSNFDYTPKYLYSDSDTLRELEKEINGFSFSPALVFYTSSGNSSEIEISRFRYSSV